ncbi:MAG: AmmeMemoRadiSam system radical SAM enzyme [Bacteroidales bacterium]
MKQYKITHSKRRFIKTGMIGAASLFCGFIPDIYGSSKSQVSSLRLTKDDLWKWSKEGMFYELSPRGVTCLICPNECTIKEGDTGDCRSRVNYKGKLYSIAYGNPCAVHIDPVEKKPLYHFLPGSKSYSIATAGCNLACLNCQNWSISQSSPRETRNYDLMPDRLVAESVKNNCRSIAYTYSEPVTFYEYTYDSSKLARSRGIKNIIVSAGYINEKPLLELAKYIDAANIDLKSFKDSTYLKLNGGRLQPVLDTLLTLKRAGVWLEITNLLVPGWTDDLNMITDMCKWLYDNGLSETPLHFSRFYPQYKLTQLPATPVNTLIKARETALKEGLKYVYIGNAPGSGAENTICPHCNKIVVERKGYTIISNNIAEKKCKFCNHPIAGVWD